MNTNPLFYNPLQAGMATELPETAIPRNEYTAGIQDKRTELQRQQVMNGSAWKPGGYLYNQENPKAVPTKHKSGLFMVYVDPPEEPKVEPVKEEVLQQARTQKSPDWLVTAKSRKKSIEIPRASSE